MIVDWINSLPLWVIWLALVAAISYMFIVLYRK